MYEYSAQGVFCLVNKCWNFAPKLGGYNSGCGLLAPKVTFGTFLVTMYLTSRRYSTSFALSMHGLGWIYGLM